MNLNLMDPKFIMLAGVVILVIAVLAWMYMRKRRGTTADLRQRFGPEYERAVLKHGSERKAEAKLVDREKRVEKLNLRDLDLDGTRTLFETVGVRTVSLCRLPQRGGHGSR